MIVVAGTTHGVILRAGGRKGETMTKRKHARGWPPKGSYPLPGGGYALDGRNNATKSGRKIVVTAKLRTEPDLEKLALAVIELAKHLDKQQRKKRL
jgi:hypothetical protein